MKKHLIFAACLAAMLAACSNEEAVQVEKHEGQVKFLIGGAVTRTTTNDSFVTSFIDGDQIGIYGTKGAEGNTNVMHEVSDGALVSDEGVYYTGIGGNTANFYAYYPYCTQATAGQVDFSVGTDQSTEALFNANDFMTAEATGISIDSEDAIELKFKHRLTLVQLEVVAATTALSPDAVTLGGCQPTISWAYEAGTLATSGTAADIKMWDKKADGSLFWAMVPEQTIPAGTQLLTLRVGEQEYIFTTSNAIALTAGSVKKFKIGVGDDGDLVVFSTDITGGTWDDSELVVEGTGTLLKPGILLEEHNMNNFTATDITKSKEQITGAGWWRFAIFDTDKVEVADLGGTQGNAMHLYRELQAGASGISWHNGAYYYCVENVVKGKYTLKFKAKSLPEEDEALMKAHQLRIGAYMQTATVQEDGSTKYTDYFAIIEKAAKDDAVDEATTTYLQVLTTDYQEYSLTFNLGKVSTIHNASKDKVTEDSKSVPTKDMLKKVVLYITSNASGVDFYLDDISWVPAE